MKKYKYETHLHTYPVSNCAHNSVEENLDFYKSKGYDGVFITNHFLDGNINVNKRKSYLKKIEFYFSDYETALEYGKKIGLKVFFGAELSYGGTDFLIYGLDKSWYLAHPEIMKMSKREELEFMMKEGALVIHAHPFREAGYIDHIRLYPRSVEGVEVINACRTDFENDMAMQYADSYGFLKSAGSDNHIADKIKVLAGVSTDEPLNSEADFINAIRTQNIEIFTIKNR